ncbi:MAG TPA: AMP-binding protein [Candidatus Acidoferrales bacterium]
MTPPTTLTGYLDSFHARGHETAYVHKHGYRTVRWSYQRIAEAAWQLARELESRGIAKGDRVVIWGENCAEWIVAFFGCLVRGAVVVPMDHIASPDFARRVAEQVDAKLIVGAAAHAQHLRPLQAITFDAMEETLARHASTRVEPVAAEPKDLVEIVFTSGTTAEPKGVAISHRNILVNLGPLEVEIDKYRIYGRPFHPLRFLNLLPLSHVFGQFLGIFIPQMIGGVVIFQESLNPGETIRLVKRERVSVIVTVPRLLESLREKILRDVETEGRMDWFRRQYEKSATGHFLWRWWRFRRIHRQFGWKFWAFISGGAALDAGVEEWWRRLGYVVIQGYGLTETTSLISVNHPFQLARGSIGKVLPGREMKLDENGEILVRGENIAAGYWQGKELKPVQSEEGWFRTGDLGELDAEGRLYFKGRVKNVIVTPEGLNVYPEDLEAALRRQPEVRDAVVVGLARERNAVPCAVLILRSPGDNSEAAAEQAVKRANESLAEFQKMRQWVVWPEEDFPRTSTQKPRTNAIQAWVQQKLTGAPAGPVAAGPLGELISRVTGRAPAALTSNLRLDTDLNLSSIERVELMSALEDRFQTSVDEVQFSAVTTVGDLEQILHQPQMQGPQYHYPRWAQRWPMTWIRTACYYLLALPLHRMMCWPRVVGRENVRGEKGPFLVISNHVTYLDASFVVVALPRHIRRRLAVSMAGEMLVAMRNPPEQWPWWKRTWEVVLYWLMTGLFNVFPLPQYTGFRESFAFIGETADRGYSVLVFPEGRRTTDGKLSPFRAGVGLLAGRLGIPVLPVRLDGLYALKLSGKSSAPAGSVTVSIGKPVRFAPGTPADEITRTLEQAMESLGRGTREV